MDAQSPATPETDNSETEMKTRTLDIPYIIGVSFLIAVIVAALTAPRHRSIPAPHSEPVAPKRAPTLYEDFVMGSKTAVSNATKHQSPPPGWYIVCDDHGNYAPASGGHVFDRPSDSMIRKSSFEAIVAAWRVKEIQDSPLPAVMDHRTNVWHDCE